MQSGLTYLYILGAGHSGSTILEALLDTHQEVRGTGEVHRLTLNPESRLCGCGKEIINCGFWSKILSEAVSHQPLDTVNWQEEFMTTLLRNNGLQNRINDLVLLSQSKLAMRLLGHVPYVSGYRKVIQNSIKVAEIIARIQNVNVVIDSTKNPMRMLGLNMYSQRKLKVIYLLRNGKAVAASTIRRKGMTMQQAATDWLGVQRKVRIALARMSERQWMAVKYEDLCSQPENVIGRIADFLDVDYEGFNTRAIDATQYHSIPGNPWLTDVDDRSKPIILKEDERWKNELSQEGNMVFENIAGEMNRKLGYD